MGMAWEAAVEAEQATANRTDGVMAKGAEGNRLDMPAASDQLKKFSFPSLWKANIMAFGVIFLVAISVAIWQTRYLNKVFLNEARDHARLAAEIIKLNAQNAMEAAKMSRDIVSSFLKSQIKFIRYLQRVEPFTQDELAAFAHEAGLAGITILDNASGEIIESADGWLKGKAPSLCRQASALRTIEHDHIFILNSPGRKDETVCVITGIDATNVQKLQQRISLDNTIKKISHLAGVKFVRITDRESACSEINGWGCAADCNTRHDVLYLDTPSGPVVRVQFELGSDVLVLGMDASSLRKKQKNIWMLFLFFTLVLVLTGGIVTWLLYKHQMSYLEKMRDYEEELFQKRHEASLGRSAATIAHEIRNPLNSVSMGIQKMLMDKKGMSEHNISLLLMLKDELVRVERIISGLLSYAKPMKINRQPVLLSQEIRKVLTRLRSRHSVEDTGIDFRISAETQVEADQHLVSQLFENLLSNAMDAQPDGGSIEIEFLVEPGFQVVRLSNQGHIPSRQDLEQLFEPYFTLKTRGTGLGLAICKRIMKAHHGFLRATVKNGTFSIEVGFPITPGNRNRKTVG